MFKPRYTRVRPEPGRPVQVQVMGPEFLDVLLARNLSRSGLAVYLARGVAGVKEGQEIELVVTLPGHKPFRALGEVRHITELLDEEFFGVELIDLPAGAQALLEEYVAERVRQERRQTVKRAG